jgi:hypothetical protein
LLASAALAPAALAPAGEVSRELASLERALQEPAAREPAAREPVSRATAEWPAIRPPEPAGRRVRAGAGREEQRRAGAVARRVALVSVAAPGSEAAAGRGAREAGEDLVARAAAAVPAGR